MFNVIPPEDVKRVLDLAERWMKVQEAREKRCAATDAAIVKVANLFPAVLASIMGGNGGGIHPEDR